MSESPKLPSARGPLSRAVIGAIAGLDIAYPAVASVGDIADDDLQLALYCCFELHYRGFADLVSEMEWDPGLLAFRAQLEQSFVEGLRAELGVAIGPSHPAHHISMLATQGGGPSLSTYLCEQGNLDQFREFCVHRSAYQLKEADPHTWAIPRLSGVAKAALVRLQSDEYGNGRFAEMHSSLFANTMEAVGLDATYGSYVDELPGVTLATGNLVSLFGLHRRWRGALVGHLALFETTSVIPMSRYRDGLRRLGFGREATAFYDVHIVADVEHEVIALQELVTGLVRDQPELAGDVIFGARALSLVERRFTEHLLGSWSNARSSLSARAA